MTLVLEIEFLAGVSFAAVGPESPVPDWPPQPDRIFSALVATWAAHGQDRQEAEALEWLEALPPPRIHASESEPRTAVTVYVPPNDPRSDKQKNARGVLPALRNRQPRRFPAARPHDPVVRLVWPDVQPTDEVRLALQRLALDTAYIGHSSSLTRCRFLCDDGVSLDEANPPLRRVYPGRLSELRQRFESGRRPLPGAPFAPPPEAPAEPTNVFADRWLLLEYVAGDMPDLRACALVGKAIRDTLLSGYRQCGLGHAVPEVVSGHTADGAPSRSPHLAIVPLAFAGDAYADGHIMGFALVPPRGSAILDNADFKAVLRRLAPLDETRGRRILTVRTPAGTIELSPTFEPPAGKRSLDPARYTEPARIFATLTPIVLDRHLKAKGAERQDEIAAQIAAACRNIGLPEPDAVLPDKHSALEGAPSAYPSGRAPAWMRWRLPASLASRQLTHAVLRFPQPVEGPVLLGAGRFVGLGLCRPIHTKG